MNNFDQVVATERTSALATNKVIRNTYMLLSMTLLFSAATAAISMAIAPSPGMSLIATLGAIGLIWLVLPRTEDSAMGIVTVFGITGLLGFGLGPMLNAYAGLPNGTQIIATALGGTGAIFLGLSGYVLTTRRDFSFMAGFLFVGMMVVLLAIVANIVMGLFGVQMPAFSLAISAVVVLLMSGMILYDTSRIINGGETNYIRATVSLFLDLYNLFIHLLHLLAAFAGGND